jgi:hypothetical protein
MPIPDKGFFDPDPDQTTEKPLELPTDSVVSAIDRMEQMEAEAAEKLKIAQEAEGRRLQREEEATKQARKEEDEFVDKLSKLSDPQSREELLDRIRAMRAEKPKPYVPPPVSPAIAEQTRLEMEVGARNQAKVQAMMEANQAERMAALKEDEARNGTNVPVYHQNPTMNEKFPTIKSTIK